jgi:hypothetical protein
MPSAAHHPPLTVNNTHHLAQRGCTLHCKAAVEGICPPVERPAKQTDCQRAPKLCRGQVTNGHFIRLDHTRRLHLLHVRSTSKGVTEFLILYCGPRPVVCCFVGFDTCIQVSTHVSFCMWLCVYFTENYSWKRRALFKDSTLMGQKPPKM